MRDRYPSMRCMVLSSETFLHENGVYPLVKLKTDCIERADMAEANVVTIDPRDFGKVFFFGVSHYQGI